MRYLLQQARDALNDQTSELNIDLIKAIDKELAKPKPKPIAYRVTAHTNTWRKEMTVFSDNQSGIGSFPKDYEMAGGYSSIPLYAEHE